MKYALMPSSQNLEVTVDINPRRLTKSVATDLLDRSGESESRLSDARGNVVLAATKIIAAACMECVGRGNRSRNWITVRVTQTLNLPAGTFHVTHIEGGISFDSRDLDCMEAA